MKSKKQKENAFCFPTSHMVYRGAEYVNASGITKLVPNTDYYIHIRGKIVSVYDADSEWITTIPYNSSEWTYLSYGPRKKSTRKR